MEFHSGYLYSDDYTPYLPVRAVDIVDRWDYKGPILRIKLKEFDPQIPQTLMVFARHEGFDHYLVSGKDVSVNIVSDVPSLPISEAFFHPGKVLLAIGQFTKDFPKNALSEQPDFNPSEERWWEKGKHPSINPD